MAGGPAQAGQGAAEDTREKSARRRGAPPLGAPASQRLAEVIAELEALAEELRGYNPNVHPLKFAVKQRWEDRVLRALTALRLEAADGPG